MPLKTCEKCDEKVGVRTKECPKCGGRFSAKLARLNKPKIDKELSSWTELMVGDIIKVRGGPFYDGESDRVPMGQNGLFKVHKVQKDGILAFDKESGGVTFINMVSSGYNQETGLHKCPHEIKRIKQ